MNFLQVGFDIIEMTGCFSLASGFIRLQEPGSYLVQNTSSGTSAVITSLDTQSTCARNIGVLLTELEERCRNEFKYQFPWSRISERVSDAISNGFVCDIGKAYTQVGYLIHNGAMLYVDNAEDVYSTVPMEQLLDQIDLCLMPIRPLHTELESRYRISVEDAVDLEEVIKKALSVGAATKLSRYLGRNKRSDSDK